ncbi:hypothetical protein [Clostridium sp.]|uniref:hypothetical protein n=1 Tax=Clostridium sp. TaxID=1506 RepID=UPI0026DA9E25|nr:hypothetical protein [Clostridium sp.]MDO5039072.1 hypothetical protein [Clostridium sp.]
MNEYGAFKVCCENRNVREYNMYHNPKPILMNDDLRESIERLLWYVPGIDSVQSYRHELIDDTLYSEAVFEFILEYIGIDKNKDTAILNKNQLSKYIRSYENKICESCQKIILSIGKNYNTNKKETITRSLLRHIRNSIAHGSFVTINDLVIFRDKNKYDDDMAFIKIRASKLNQALKLIEKHDGITQEKIISKVFKNNGFNVYMGRYKVSKGRKVIYPDMILEKCGKKFIIEIKHHKIKSRKVNKDFINNMIIYYEELNEEYTPIVICDKSTILEETKYILLENNIILLDKREIKKLINLDKSLFKNTLL